MKEKTVVGGYTILERRQVGEVMIALGHNPAAPAPYAVRIWRADYCVQQGDPVRHRRGVNSAGAGWMARPLIRLNLR